jgi:hypothetical protein
MGTMPDEDEHVVIVGEGSGSLPTMVAEALARARGAMPPRQIMFMSALHQARDNFVAGVRNMAILGADLERAIDTLSIDPEYADKAQKLRDKQAEVIRLQGEMNALAVALNEDMMEQGAPVVDTIGDEGVGQYL